MAVASASNLPFNFVASSAVEFDFCIMMSSLIK